MEIRIKSKNKEGDITLDKMLKEKTYGTAKLVLIQKEPKIISMQIPQIMKITKAFLNVNFEVYVISEVNTILIKYGGKIENFEVCLSE